MGLRWIGGDGQWLPGVPARDLTDDEAGEYPQAAASGLYAPTQAAKSNTSKPLPQGEVLPEPDEE
jgi:hypothetical protein